MVLVLQQLNKTNLHICVDFFILHFVKAQKNLVNWLGYVCAWQLVIFTMARIAIVTTKMLNFCVRNGYRCVHLAIITRLLKVNPSKLNNRFFSPKTYSWLSPRPISISQLHISLHFHLWPIYLVVFKGSYYLRMGNLILKLVSRLDAFSAYLFPT